MCGLVPVHQSRTVTADDARRRAGRERGMRVDCTRSPSLNGVWSDLQVATYLYRIGRWAFRRRRLVTRVWLGALLVAVAAVALAPAAEEEDITMPGTESQKAFDLLDKRFPGSNSQGAEA